MPNCHICLFISPFHLTFTRTWVILPIVVGDIAHYWGDMLAAVTNQYRECQRRIPKKRVCTVKQASIWALSHKWFTIDDITEILAEVPSRLAFEFWTQTQEDPNEIRKFIPRPRGVDEEVEKPSEGESGGPDGPLARALSAIDSPSPTPK